MHAARWLGCSVVTIEDGAFEALVGAALVLFCKQRVADAVPDAPASSRSHTGSRAVGWSVRRAIIRRCACMHACALQFTDVLMTARLKVFFSLSVKLGSSALFPMSK